MCILAKSISVSVVNCSNGKQPSDTLSGDVTVLTHCWWVLPLQSFHSRCLGLASHVCHWWPGTGHRKTWWCGTVSLGCQCRSLCSIILCKAQCGRGYWKRGWGQEMSWLWWSVMIKQWFEAECSVAPALFLWELLSLRYWFLLIWIAQLSLLQMMPLNSHYMASIEGKVQFHI